MARIKIALRLVTAVLISGLLLSGASSYAVPDTLSSDDSALAPPLATNPPCRIVNGIRTTIEIKSDTYLRKDDFNKAVDDDRIWFLFKKIRSHESLQYIYSLCADNAFDAIIDKMRVSTVKNFNGEIILELYFDDNDVVFNIIDNGKTVELDENERPIRRTRDSNLQFGGLGEGIGWVEYYVTNFYGGTIRWHPLKEGTKTEIRIPRLKMPTEFKIEKEAYIVITNDDVIESWDRETARSVGSGEILGKAFRNRWAFVDVSYLIGQMLILTQEYKLQNPKDILIPLMKKHIQNRDGMAEILLEGYDIDGIEEVREGQTITGFSLPVTRNGTPAYRLIYNLQGGETSILMRNGSMVYVKVESVELSEKMVRIAVGLASFGHGTNEVTEVLSKTQNLILSAPLAKMAITQNDKLAEYHTDIEMLCTKLDQAISILPDLHKKSLDAIRGGTLTESEVLSWLQQTQKVYSLLTECTQQLDLLKNKLQPSLSEQENVALMKLKSRMNAVYSMLADRLYVMTGKISEEQFALNDIFTHFFENLSLTSRGTFKQYFELKISDTPIYIKGNKISITSLLCNLADDCFRYAIKFRKDNAKVIIDVKVEDGKVVITIGDNGNGMSPEELANIWKPFHTTGGTGIGLTESRLIAKDHGGTIDVQSEVGKGTTFTIRLPIPQKTRVVSEDEFLSFMKRKDGNTVILDTDCSVAELFQQDLKGKDVLVISCGGGTYCFSAVLKGANRAIGVDIDENSIAIAKLLAPFIHSSLLRDGLMKYLPEIRFDNAKRVIKSMSSSADAKEQVTLKVNPNSIAKARLFSIVP